MPTRTSVQYNRKVRAGQSVYITNPPPFAALILFGGSTASPGNIRTAATQPVLNSSTHMRYGLTVRSLDTPRLGSNKRVPAGAGCQEALYSWSRGRELQRN